MGWKKIEMNGEGVVQDLIVLGSGKLVVNHI